MNVHSVYALRFCCLSSLLCRISLGLARARKKLDKTAASVKVGVYTYKHNHTDCMLLSMISVNNESMISQGRTLLSPFCGKKVLLHKIITMSPRPGSYVMSIVGSTENVQHCLYY